MSPHIIATVTIDDENHRNENYSPSSQDMNSPKPKGRILYCRKCEGHGEKVILKNHSPQCPYILCNCKSCEKLNYKRLKSFNKRNKEKIELAAALNAKRHATGSSSSVDDEEAFSRRSSFSSKTSTPDMDSDNRATSSTTPITRPSPTTSATGLEKRSQTLGNAKNVMSYDIWKAKCASEKQRLEEERAKKTSADPFTRSPSPIQIRKRAHTFVAHTGTHNEEIPVIAPKKLSMDDNGKGKYVVLPTIPAVRIYVTEENKAPALPMPTITSQVPMTLPQIPITTPTASILDIPSTSSNLRPFQMPTAVTSALPRPSPILAPPQLSPFKPVVTSPPLNNLSTEQSISSLILHNTVLQQQQQQQQSNNFMQDLLGTTTPQPPVDVLSMLRLQQQAAALAAALQAAGIQIPMTSAAPAPAPAPISVATPLPTFQKSIPNLSNPLLNPFLQSPLFTNPV